MIVISDTSSISNLAAIGQLLLLKCLYSVVIIPDAVYKELALSPFLSSNKTLDSYNWVQVRSVGDRTLVDDLLTELDTGEAEAIALATMKAELLLLDEADARRVAKREGLKRTGVLGVLTEAKAQGLITEIRPLILALRDQADFWLSKSLCNEVLRSVGENLM